MVTVYACRLNSQSSKTDYLKLLPQISEERRQKSSRFRFEEDRMRSVLGESLIRYFVEENNLLNHQELILKQGVEGKPYISNLPNCQFNLAHSGDWVVCVWADFPVGIDIEKKTPENTDMKIAQSFFHPKEYELIKQAHDRKQEDLFYLIWTLKESYLKYLGSGLMRSLSSFYFHLTNEKAPVVVDQGMRQTLYFATQNLDQHALAICSPEIFLLEVKEVSVSQLVTSLVRTNERTDL